MARFFLLFPLWIALVSARRQPPFGAKQPSLPTILRMRGGAGPLDASQVAKVTTGVVLAQGALLRFCPKPCLEGYGLSLTDLDQSFAERSGAALLAIGLPMYGMLFQDMSLHKAIGYATIVWLVEGGASIINKDSETYGYDSTGIILWTVLHSILVYGCFSDADWATSLIKFEGIALTLSSAVFTFDPNIFRKAYRMKQEFSPHTMQLARGVWYLVTSYGIIMTALAFDVDTTKALGYAWMYQLVSVIFANFITKDVEKLGMPRAPQVVWMIFNLAVVVTLAI